MTPTTSAAISPAVSLLDLFTPLGLFVGGAPTVEGVLGGMLLVWNIYTGLAFAFSAFFIFGIIYATQRTAQLEQLQDDYLRSQEKLFAQIKYGNKSNDRWSDVMLHIQSGNPNDWRLAIIEADILLEESLEEMGLAGNTIGEKLKSASPTQFTTLDDAWKAHRVRNEIAHAGSDFVLTQKTAQETINQFKRVFVELGKI